MTQGLQAAEVPWFLWLLLGIILLSQAIFVYFDAAKRGEKKWLWGIFALLNTPSNLIVYLIVTRVIHQQKKCPFCKNPANRNARFCPECGKPFDKKLAEKNKIE